MQPNGFVKCLVTGTCVGIVISTMVNPPDSGDIKRLNRSANKAWTTVGSMIDGVMGTFK